MYGAFIAAWLIVGVFMALNLEAKAAVLIAAFGSLALNGLFELWLRRVNENCWRKYVKGDL